MQSIGSGAPSVYNLQSIGSGESSIYNVQSVGSGASFMYNVQSIGSGVSSSGGGSSRTAPAALTHSDAQFGPRPFNWR